MYICNGKSIIIHSQKSMEAVVHQFLKLFEYCRDVHASFTKWKPKVVQTPEPHVQVSSNRVWWVSRASEDL